MILINKLEKSYNGKKVLDIDKILYSFAEHGA